jgi:hypothetical protein
MLVSSQPTEPLPPPAHFGTHSRAIRCASAICRGVILAANLSRMFAAIFKDSAALAFGNHITNAQPP